MRNISLNRLKNQQKLSVDIKFTHQESPDKDKFLTDRQKRPLKNNYEPLNILQVLPKLFEMLISKQLSEFWKNLTEMLMRLYFMVRNIAYKWATDNKK